MKTHILFVSAAIFWSLPLLESVDVAVLFPVDNSFSATTMADLHMLCVCESSAEIEREDSVRDYSPLQCVANWLIEFHQEVISPVDGPRSHFKPSSSEYTKCAIQKYGFLRGFLLGCDRLLRENNDPWVYRTTENSDGSPIKWNPVP